MAGSERFSDTATKRIKQDDTYRSLSFEQKLLFDKVVFERQSVFFTGQAGSGKSYLLRSMIKTLGTLFREQAICVTSMTGIAAVNIKG